MHSTSSGQLSVTQWVSGACRVSSHTLVNTKGILSRQLYTQERTSCSSAEVKTAMMTTTYAAILVAFILPFLNPNETQKHVASNARCEKIRQYGPWKMRRGSPELASVEEETEEEKEEEKGEWN
ncbi:hypothetical protein CAPTEDRAFT_200760 [Capitella teleta]|uniref:Uncharacterized protein n=1 Tax=Capitella teleta TaxID=283909 RepID=R7V5R8_CAPTE|nr:hypothetical protein CAPTEDRAFT_200760 [Capitella teleta]|eukprot:ELU13929.1 hypothetical protein CAPTEDRAFT_200760 [Capitella teleta]